MGILNVTPDSFSDGGRYDDTELAVRHAGDMAAAGADIVDIGGESTRPGADPVPADEECRRILPVIEAVAAAGIPVSVDTWKAAVAARALETGAVMVNDITALRGDPDMAAVVRDSGAGLVLMHMQGSPRTMQDNPAYDDPVTDILAFLRDRLEAAEAAGITLDRLVVDPGIGFGKTYAHNIALLRGIGRFHELGRPVLVGASRKGFIGTATGAPVGSRDWGTAAVTAWCVAEGVQIHRVHDATGMRQVCDMMAAVTFGCPAAVEV